MNISGLLRSFIGELQASDAKTLELKVGQIVKGIVLQLLSEQDALVNIGGVQVRARLETPLKQGESTLLQVQPESAGGQPVLKPLQGSQTQIAESSMPELLKEFGLKDDAMSRLLLRTMQQDGVPLTKDTATAFADGLKAKPGRVDPKEWIQTASLALKRGLPVSTETVQALRQVLSGPPMFELLQRLGEETEAALRDPGLPDGLKRQLTEMTAVLREAVGGASVPAEGGGDGGLPAPASQARAAAAAPSAASGGGEPPARASEAPPAPPAGRAAPAVDARLPAAAQQQATAPGGAASPAAQGPAAAAARPAAAEPLPGGAAAQPMPQAPAGDAAVAAPRAASGAAAQEPAPDHWIGRMLKALGVEHERGILLRDMGGELQRKLPEPGAPEAAAPSEDSPARTAGDTLKGLLLQIMNDNELPSGLKDTMQQAVQQITGQQLLLTPDRSAPFAQVTMFVPFRDENGQQTASVHIQSRRGSRGQLDADNCRLLFDLAMKGMGNTLLDVQVVDRVVSLNVHNDHPAVQLLIEQYRDEITGALQQTGYQLLSLKFNPYPRPSDRVKQSQTEGTAGADSVKSQQLKSLVQTKPYKGVDFRV